MNAESYIKNAWKLDFLMKQNMILYQKKLSGKSIFYGVLEME